MGKFLAWIVFTLFCIGLALVPEAVMYFTYNLIAPTSEMAKIVVLAMFWLGGAGVCILFGFIGFALWASMTQEFLK